MKDCVLNELSFAGVASEGDPDRMLIALAELLSPLGRDAVLWACPGIWSRGLAACRERLLAGRAMTDDSVRRVSAVLTRLQALPEQPTANWMHKSEGARGLGHALALGGLAVSLDRTPWQVASVELTRRGTDSELEVQKVRHASQAQHLGGHVNWTGLSDTDRASVLITVKVATHKPASEYKKHVRGASNDERRTSASGPKAPGQFLCVGDEQIQRWEAAVLGRAREGRDGFRLDVRGSAEFHIYAQLDEVVGYGTGGMETRCLRVEWKDGEVHSHPRPENDIAGV